MREEPVLRLCGKIISENTLNGKISISPNGKNTLHGIISISRYHDKYPDYEGEYVVTPKVIEQTLETKEKSMLDDVTVNPIPYQEVSNLYGVTVAIGS